MVTFTESRIDTRKNAVAVGLMRSMLMKYAQKYRLSFEEAMLRFCASSTYEMLFDFSTAVWREGPDYLMELYEEELSDKE